MIRAAAKRPLLRPGATTNAAKPLVGTAGWSLPTALAAEFPGDGSHLARYAQRFGGVEVNSSFYRSHRHATWQRWADSVPDTFRFAVKMPRALTHEARLHAPEAVLDQFAGEVAGLGTKLGPLLVQTPPSLGLEPKIAKRFFAALRARFEGAIAFEPRHESWFAATSDALLALHKISRVAADPAKWPVAAAPGGDARLAYWRLHGSPRIYYSNYEPDARVAIAKALRAARRTHREVWCIFDNTAAGFALGNALDVHTRTRR